MTKIVETPSLTATTSPTPLTRVFTEMLGTYILVFVVIGAALFAAAFDGGENGLSIGFLGVSLAAGLVFVAIAYAFGMVSGAHLNPAVTLGLAVGGRFSWREVPGYVIGQIAGALLATTTLLAIAGGGPAGLGEELTQAGFASAGWGPLSPGGFDLLAALLVEVVTTAIFVAIILRTTSADARPEFAPLAIGLALAVLLLVAIPVSNGSLNPARAIATAVYGGPVALGQVWLGVLGPILGGVVAGASARLSRSRAR